MIYEVTRIDIFKNLGLDYTHIQYICQQSLQGYTRNRDSNAYVCHWQWIL